MNVMGSPREDTSYETDLHCDEETKTDLMYYIIRVWSCIFSDTRNVFSLTPLLFGDPHDRKGGGLVILIPQLRWETMFPLSI